MRKERGEFPIAQGGRCVLILMPAVDDGGASILSPQAEETNAIIYLANVGAVSLAARLLALGLVRRRGE